MADILMWFFIYIGGQEKMADHWPIFISKRNVIAGAMVVYDITKKDR